MEGAFKRGTRSLRVEEPEWTSEGPTLSRALGEAGFHVGGAEAEAQVIVRASRLPLTDSERAELQRRCAERPTALIGMQNDAFLDQVPQAALRLSASDSTPLTRRRVAVRLTSELAGAPRA